MAFATPQARRTVTIVGGGVSGAVLGARGEVSTWLHALGPLTRPAWWEITAVPEITAQVDGLAHRLAEDQVATPSLEDALVNLGAGI